MKKINGKDAIIVHKEDQYVERKPEEPTFHGTDENGKMINVTKIKHIFTQVIISILNQQM